MKNLVTSLLMILVFTLLLGVGYPFAVWAVAQMVFPHQANGSLISQEGKTVGSELLGQTFNSPGYFYSRPSAAGSGYDGGASGGSNLGPTSAKLIHRISADAETRESENPGVSIPGDLVTTSGSGLDPHITPAAAYYQIPRVARERGITETELQAIVESYTEQRQLGFLGEPRVNVLRLNLELDRRKNRASP